MPGPKNIGPRSLLKLAQSHEERAQEERKVKARALKLSKRAAPHGVDLADEDAGPMAHLVAEHCTWEPWVEIWALPNASYSNYSGSYVERSNAAYLRSMFPDFIEVRHGGAGSEWVGITEATRNSLDDGGEYAEQAEEFKDVLETLAGGDYPILDEDAMYRMEEEAKMQAWDEFARSEFVTKVVDKCTSLLLATAWRVAKPAEVDDALQDHWGDLEAEIEEGGGVYYRGLAKAAELVADEGVEPSALARALLKLRRGFKAEVAGQFVKTAPEAFQRDLVRLGDGSLFRLFLNLAEAAYADGVAAWDTDREGDITFDAGKYDRLWDYATPHALQVSTRDSLRRQTLFPFAESGRRLVDYLLA